MNNTIKQIALIAIAFTFTFVSCVTPIEEVEQRTEAQELEEISQLISKVESEGLDVDTTALGIYYVVDSVGTGPTPMVGDTCFMEYTGSFIDGSIFDDSSYHPENVDGVWEFVFKENSLIPGFEDGITLMSKGTKLNLIVPSSLGYGPSGSYSIPPYATLIFKTKMVDLRPASN